MNEYRIKLNYTKNGYQERLTNANYGDGLTLDYTKESGQEFFREKLTGKILFINDDYQFIMDAGIDTKINFVMEIYEYGNWYTYLEGYFYRTDCKINADDQIIEVEPTTNDQYEDFLGALDKEVDLIKIAPKITPVRLDKRPCLQIYAAGQSVIGCILGNMYWEQECDAISDEGELTGTYKFADWKNAVVVRIGGTHTPATPDVMSGFVNDADDFTLTSGTATLQSIFGVNHWVVAINVNGERFYGESTIDELTFPRSITLEAVGGATGTCILNFEVLHFFVRMISDSAQIAGVETAELPAEDMAGANRNYKRVSPVSKGGDLQIMINPILSSTPTEWGLYDTDEYYTEPPLVSGRWNPVNRSLWGLASYWISQSSALKIFEEDGRKTVLLKDAYRLEDVISAMLAEVAPNIGWLNSYSQFLFSATNPLSGEDNLRKYIVPKSNLLNVNYTQPAQKAPITLRQLLDMLKTCYRCYWYIINSTLHIEHIEYFRRGMRYTGSPSLGADLTTKVAVRNGKPWAYLTSKYQFDKVDMPYRYEFGWADNETEPFDGLPIEMQSNFVNKERVEKFSVENFDADVDYLMLNPSGISKDGFVILEADLQNIITNPITLTGLTITVPILGYNSPNGEAVSVVYDCAGSGIVYALDYSWLTILGVVDTWSADGSGVHTTWNLPAGTAAIAVKLDNAADSFTLQEFYPAALKVGYWEWKPDPNDNTLIYVLQNGTMSFANLQQWYDYDMPCKDYIVGAGSYAVPKIAQGVTKNKTQEITFPTIGYFDVRKLVKTNLGNGKIRKLSINLSSKQGKGTLEYDTE